MQPWQLAAPANRKHKYLVLSTRLIPAFVLQPRPAFRLLAALDLGEENDQILRPPPPPPPPPPAVPPDPPKRSGSKVLLPLLILGLLGGAGYVATSRQPAEAPTAEPAAAPARAATPVLQTTPSPARAITSAPRNQSARPGADTLPVAPAQLKALWEQGARAKHSGDFAAARAAWQKMLQLRPGHPGVQAAIDKLAAIDEPSAPTRGKVVESRSPPTRYERGR